MFYRLINKISSKTGADKQPSRRNEREPSRHVESNKRTP